MAEFLFPERTVDRSELLIRCGFIRKDKEGKFVGNYKYNQEKEEWEPAEGYTFDKKDANEELRQSTFHQPFPEGFILTGFPRPLKSYRLSYEVYDLSLEEPYFWTLEYLRQQFEEIDKLEDSFAAAENSAFFGVTQQRLGAQQDKISQFLATTGKMVKELFQMVRELRIIDERLKYYGDAQEQVKKKVVERGKGAEITLKGIFVDLVQGGGKSAASVYGMARELEFITLPDLFFDAPPFKDIPELEKHVQEMKGNFNDNVLRVLVRHLVQFHEWKIRTYQEHEHRKRFMLKYLEQHFQIINMYLSWVRPYLRHVEKLNLKEKNMASPEIISAFEGSMLDIELLAKHKIEVGATRTNVYDCLLATFNYRTRPELKVVQEGYQRGPVHIGRFELNFRVYHWDAEEVENYKKFKRKESLHLLGNISSTVEAAMKSLGSELDHYLAEATGEMERKAEKKQVAVAERSWKQQWFGFHTEKSGSKKPAQPVDQFTIDNWKKDCKGHAVFHAWNGYHTFKKAHRMVAW